MIMSLYSKVFDVLVNEQRAVTAKQLGAWFKTTPASINARVSEIRSAGYPVYANRKTDSQGRTATYLRVGTPTRAMVAAGIAALRA
jgi:cell division septation protein DedD